MNKVIFITGVAGMVGSNLLKKFIKKKNLIIGIDNFTLGKKKFLDPFINKKNFIFLKKDLSKKIISKKLDKILKKNYLSEVWLLAANSDILKGLNNPKVDLKNTFLTTLHSLNYIKSFINKNTKVIFSSSSAIYGNVVKKISENNSNYKPISNYGNMKLSSEVFLSSFSNIYNIKTYIFRFPNVIGNNLTHGLLYDMKKKILSKKKFILVLGNGNQQKPYSHVEEIINCMIFVKNKKLKGKFNVYNIGTDDKGLKVKTIVNMMVKAFKSKKKIIYEKKNIGWIGDVPKYSYSTKKLNKLGFHFKLNSKESVNLTIKKLN